MPSPVPGKEEPGNDTGWSQPVWGEDVLKRPWKSWCWWVALEPAVRSGNREGNSIQACIRGSVTKRSREGIIPLYSALTRLHLEHCAVLVPPVQKRHWWLAASSLRRHQAGWDWGWEYLPCEGSWSCSAQRWFWQDLKAAFPCHQGGYQKDEAKLFTVVHGWIGDNKQNLKFDKNKSFFLWG